MRYITLISVPQLQALQASGAALMLFDCSFELGDPSAGERQFLESHIPGAVHADLDTALSDKRLPAAGPQSRSAVDLPASGGRHPLPSRERFAAWLSSVGLGNDMQAVVYDRNGANYCGRLWWMLKWAGHEAAAALDGGLQAWVAAGGSVKRGPERAHFQSNFVLGSEQAALVGTQTVAQRLGQSSQTLLDARSAPRFRGEVEPLDPVAGHIPGALNRPFGQNLDTEGKFKPAQVLRAEFEALLGGRDPASVVHHCGSGVSAVPNILAMEVAGLGPTALYAGSWSEWCSDPQRPVARS